MNTALENWNLVTLDAAVEQLSHCCAARRWAAAMSAQRPFPSVESLYTSADQAWATMEESDWMEAFRAHPRIGEQKAVHATAQSRAWSSQEQVSVDEAQTRLLERLAEGNRSYEERFGFTYIVCATGKRAEQMLEILEARLTNDRLTELSMAAEQQRQIMQLRLRKWLEA